MNVVHHEYIIFLINRKVVCCSGLMAVHMLVVIIYTPNERSVRLSKCTRSELAKQLGR